MSTDAKLVMVALDAALRHDGDALDRAMEEIYRTDGWNSLFAACCGWIGGLLGAQPARGAAAMAVIDLDTGRQVAPEQSGIDPEFIAALRMQTAIANRDIPAARDVFDAEVSAGRGNDLVPAVLALVTRQLEQLPKYAQVYRKDRP